MKELLTESFAMPARPWRPGACAESCARRWLPWTGTLAALLLLAAGCVSAAPDWRDVRLVRDRADVEGCRLVTILKDEDMNDLRRKAAESGGDTVLVTGSEGGSVPVVNPPRFVADVYRCRPAG
jgi:hypothetical protein